MGEPSNSIIHFRPVQHLKSVRWSNGRVRATYVIQCPCTAQHTMHRLYRSKGGKNFLDRLPCGFYASFDKDGLVILTYVNPKEPGQP